jgi:hypothetical protein
VAFVAAGWAIALGPEALNAATPAVASKVKKRDFPTDRFSIWLPFPMTAIVLVDLGHCTTPWLIHFSTAPIQVLDGFMQNSHEVACTPRSSRTNITHILCIFCAGLPAYLPL